MTKKKVATPAAPVLTSKGSRFTPTGLSLTASLPFEEWKALGGQLLRMERGINWYIGDWLNYGQARYGEKYTPVVEATGRDAQTLANIAWVAGQFNPSRRRDSLSWSHHAEVAALDPADADQLLEAAERERWGKRALREAVQRLRHRLPEQDARPELDVPELNRRIAAQVARVREISGLPQRAAAEEALGSAALQGTWSKIETGKNRPNLATLERIAQWADVPVSSFGVHDAPMLPAGPVQRAAQEALEALDAGDMKGARRVLERLATALSGEDVTNG